MSAKLKEILGTDDPKVIEIHKRAVLNSYDGGTVRSDDYAGRIPYITLKKEGIFGEPVKDGDNLSYPFTKIGEELAYKLDAERSGKSAPVIM